MTRQGDGASGGVMMMKVRGTRPRGRPKKTCRHIIEEDMCEWNLIEEDVYDRDTWIALIISQTH